MTASWTFLTNHAHTLLCLAQDPSMRLRDIAQRVGITERAVQGIVNELAAHGYIVKERQGRRNSYTVVRGMPLRHSIENHRMVDDLIALVEDPPPTAGKRKS